MPPDLSVQELTAWVWLEGNGVTPTRELATALAHRLQWSRDEGFRDGRQHGRREAQDREVPV